jgi:hypothetical protein
MNYNFGNRLIYGAFILKYYIKFRLRGYIINQVGLSR